MIQFTPDESPNVTCS